MIVTALYTASLDMLLHIGLLSGFLIGAAWMRWCEHIDG